jgi:hypothetical protein
MTVRTNSAVAGVTFLCYIAAGIGTLASAGHAHVADLLTVVTSLSALVLGVTLYTITRDQDRDLALLALLCRVVESIPGHKMGAIFFAVGSTIFCWLLLRGRLIPAVLAWLGVAASGLLVVLLLLQRAGLAGSGTNWASSLTWVVWFPLLIFEVTFGIWLIVKGVTIEERRRPA